MPHSSIERLTDQFYAWERRGRGWQVWNYAVELEPPFTPFHCHYVPLGGTLSDDGRRPTLLSRLTDRIVGGRRGEEELAVVDLDEPVARPLVCASSIREMRWSLPADQDLTPEQAEQLLLALPRFRRPLAFEVVGTTEAITTQLVCGEEDGQPLRQQVKGCFPAGALTAADGFLESCFQGEGSEVVVEFGLAEEFMLPLRVFRRFSLDPLTNVMSAMSDLECGEVAVLQVLFEPVREPWAESIMRAVLDEGGSPFFIDAPEVSKLAREKVSRPLFACVIRVATKAPNSDRAMLLARAVGWSLSTLANPPINRLIPLANDDYPDGRHKRDLIERTTRRSGMILSSAELVSLVHPPSASVKVEKLVRESGKTRPVPPVAVGHRYTLGVNSHAGRTTVVSLSEDQRSRHVYVVGASGTGKSTLLLSLILQSLERGEGLAVLDPHGDLVDEIVRRLPADRRDDVVLLDPADDEYPVGFNILQANSELERTLLASDLVSVFRRLSTSWGDQMTSVLGNAILAFLESTRGGTLVDLRRFLVEAEFRKEFLRSVHDPEVVYYWQKEFPLLAGKPQAPLLTRLDIFLRPKTIRYMVAQKDSRLDLRRTMDEGKVLLARLSQGAIGEENAYLLGTLIVSKLQQLAMSRQEQAASERRPFYLYIDEFHNFVTPSMESILSGARKYRLGLVLAHQDLRQIQSRSVDVLNSVLSNPYTRVCFRVGDQDARTLAEGFQHFDARDLQSLSTGQAIARIERSEYDFNLATSVLPGMDETNAAETRFHVVARTRERFGRPRGEIERLLARPSGVGEVELENVEIPTPPTPPRREHAATSSPPSATPSTQPPGVEIPTPASSSGRGGKQHKYLQSLICRWADANDWRSTVEEEVLGGLGRVDVTLRKGEAAIACEICVTTGLEHEVQNIQKCLAAGFTRIFVVSSNQKSLQQIRALAEKLMERTELAHFVFCSPESLFDELDAVDAQAQTSESSVRGYKVTVRHSPTASGTKRAAVASVVANALKRLRRR